MKLVATPALVILAIAYRVTDMGVMILMSVLWVQMAVSKFVPTQLGAMCDSLHVLYHHIITSDCVKLRYWH